jgi:hypothetical protein
MSKIDFAERQEWGQALALDPVIRAFCETIQEYDADLRVRLVDLRISDPATYEEIIKGCPNGFSAAYRRYLETEDLTELLEPLATDPQRLDIRTRRYVVWLQWVLDDLAGI